MSHNGCYLHILIFLADFQNKVKEKRPGFFARLSGKSEGKK